MSQKGYEVQQPSSVHISAGTIPPGLAIGGEPAAGKPPFSLRMWTSGGYFPPGVYHARGEVKGGDGSTIFDTEIELGPSLLYSAYLTGDGNSFYWVEGVPPPLVSPV